MSKIKKYGIILTTVFTVFASSLIVTFATNLTIQHGNNWNGEDLVSWATVNFADYCTGTISLTYNGSTGWNYMVLGASVTSSGSTITLSVDDCKQILILFYPYTATPSTTPPTVSIKTNSTTSVTHVNQSYLESKFQTVDGYLSDIEDQIVNIYDESHSIYLLLVDQALDLDNIQTQLTNIGNYLNTNNASLTTLINLMTVNNQGLINIANGITSLIGQAKYDISEESLTAYLYMSSLSSTGLNYEDGDIAPWYILDGGNPTSYNAPGRFMVPANTSVYLSYYAQMYTSPDAIYTSNGSNGMTYELIYSEAGYYWKQFTYKITNSTASAKLCSLHWTYTSGKVIPIYFGRDRNMTLTMSRITHIPTSDIYTDRQDEIITKIQTIINWLNTYQQKDYTEVLNEINEKLDGMEGDQTSNNNVIEFNTNMDIINDIETDFNTNFGTHNNNLDINQIDVPANFQTSVIGFKNVFTQFWNFDIFKYTTLLILLGGLILILLG